MDKSSIIAKFRAHEPELKAAGVEHLALHGSYVRGTAEATQSDLQSLPISRAPQSCL